MSFDQWFAGSKVTTGDGKPLPVVRLPRRPCSTQLSAFVAHQGDVVDAPVALRILRPFTFHAQGGMRFYALAEKLGESRNSMAHSLLIPLLRNLVANQRKGIKFNYRVSALNGKRDHLSCVLERILELSKQSPSRVAYYRMTTKIDIAALCDTPVLRDWVMAKGYDGFIHQSDAGRVYRPFHPDQIRSLHTMVKRT